MDVAGGDRDPFVMRNDVPACTIYGDNRIVWTNELGPFNIQVLYDQLPDDAVRYLVDYLTVAEAIYTYDAKADLQPPRNQGEDMPSPMYEVIQLNVNGQPHQTDPFAGWDYIYYQRILEVCRRLSQTPTLYEPQAGWVSAREVEYDYNLPMFPWDSEAAGLSFAELAGSGERRWVDSRNVAILWNILRTSPPSIQVAENDRYFQIAVEVPQITRDAPPAPAAPAPAGS
jgi:hypothetical protein